VKEGKVAYRIMGERKYVRMAYKGMLKKEITCE
jgi:hypothetical protein